MKDEQSFSSLDTNFKVQQNVNILEQYLLQKSIILDKLKGTFLFPYLLNMEYMIGELNGVKVTENPITELSPYLNTPNGINQTIQTKFTSEELTDWEVFKYTIYLFENEEFINTEELKIYIVIKIIGNQLNLVVFGLHGVYEPIIIKDKICYDYLEKDVKILETKKELQQLGII